MLRTPRNVRLSPCERQGGCHRGAGRATRAAPGGQPCHGVAHHGTLGSAARLLGPDSPHRTCRRPQVHPRPPGAAVWIRRPPRADGCCRAQGASRLTSAHPGDTFQHLRARGYEQPLTQVVFATHGREVYFQHDDGTWEGGLTPDQLVLSEVLNLRPLRRRIADGIQRDQADAGHVERRRGALGSKPVLAGTRVPVETVRRYLDAGRTAEQIVESFPALTAADVEAVRTGAA